MKTPARVLFIICVIFLSLPRQVRAQAAAATGPGNQSFGQGSFDINPGIGFGYDYGYLGTFYPAIIVSGDYGLNVSAGPGTIAIGGEVGFKYGTYSYTFGDYSASYSETYIAARGTYHWTPPGAPKVDLYGGIPLGFRIDHYSEWGSYVSGYDVYGYPIYGYHQISATGTDPLIGLFIGASYYVSSKIGIFAELGYNISILNIGVNIKLK